VGHLALRVDAMQHMEYPRNNKICVGRSRGQAGRNNKFTSKRQKTADAAAEAKALAEAATEVADVGEEDGIHVGRHRGQRISA
jgi:hypothetical protein